MNDRIPEHAKGEDAPPLIWDLPLRLFHWLLVLALCGSWVTHELGVAYMEWHLGIGYFTLGLVLFRIAWGFVGPTHARFGNFLRGPVAVLRYARDWLAGRSTVSAGHNPLGGWAVLAMLLLVAVQAVSGLFNSDDIFTSGPWHGAVSDAFADRMSWLHAVNFNLLLGVTALHLGAMAAYGLRLRVNLVTGMITGRKTGADPAADIAGHRLWLALALALLAGLAIWGLLALAPETGASDFSF